MESWAVSKLFPHLSGPAVVHVQEEKQWETGKIALEESSETSSCAPCQAKAYQSEVFQKFG